MSTSSTPVTIAEADEPHHAHAKTYVLTTGLDEAISTLNNIGIGTPTGSIFTEIEDELARMIRNNGYEVRRISMKDLSAEILTKARDVLNPDTFVVSTCLQIAAPARGCTLEINRIIGEDGKILGLGQRPGCVCLPSQVDGVVHMTEGRPLAFIEDGSFTGSTLLHILDKFEGRASVEGVILGFAFPRAMAALRSRLGDNVHAIEDTNGDELADWMPSHDFIPFAPNAGRPLGVMMGGTPTPFFTYEGHSHAAPYILPFAPIDDWASIGKTHPEDDEATQRESARHRHGFSLRCLELAEELFAEVSRLNDHDMTIGEVAGSWNRVSVPYMIGQRHFPQVGSTCVKDYLRDMKSILHEH